MNPLPNFKIVVLEDDDFFNKLLSHYLKTHLDNSGLINGFTVSINSYTSFNDCSVNLQPNVDILLTDYYLSDGYNAKKMIDKVKNRGIDCKIIVMSREQNLKTAIVPLLEGASEFIKKNNDVLQNCLYVSEAIVLDKLRKVN